MRGVEEQEKTDQRDQYKQKNETEMKGNALFHTNSCAATQPCPKCTHQNPNQTFTIPRDHKKINTETGDSLPKYIQYNDSYRISFHSGKTSGSAWITAERMRCTSTQTGCALIYTHQIQQNPSFQKHALGCTQYSVFGQGMSYSCWKPPEQWPGVNRRTHWGALLLLHTEALFLASRDTTLPAQTPS